MVLTVITIKTQIKIVETATAYHDRDYLFKISLLDSNNHDLRLTVNKNENSGDSRWAGTEYRPQTNQLEKIISTTTNYALSHNYNPNNLLNLDTNLNLTDISLERKMLIIKMVKEIMIIEI